MDDLLHSNSLLSNSLKHQPGTDDDEWKRKTKNEKRKEKENNRDAGERRVSRSAYHSPARGRGLGGGGEYSKRRIASVEGLTLREQEKMAEILVRTCTCTGSIIFNLNVNVCNDNDGAINLCRQLSRMRETTGVPLQSIGTKSTK